MNKCSGNQDTSTEMLAGKEDGWWHFEALESLGNDRESSPWFPWSEQVAVRVNAHGDIRYT